MTDLYAVEKKDDKAVIFAIKMPAELRDAFKAHCHTKGVDMSVVLRRFMESEITKAVPQDPAQ